MDMKYDGVSVLGVPQSRKLARAEEVRSNFWALAGSEGSRSSRYSSLEIGVGD